ncbi:UDP-glucose--hexose-1-phosphate uridylyltransferase [Sphingomonas sp.]|uniref:UDP-glucose--hexose-1-phosphate uridylyltransferase n=1 Tax=Sphingomonas sp. TaxID=28214 RepID=UPI003CC6C7E0
MTPHRRLNPLTGRHVLVSPQRAERPWQGAAEVAAAPRGPRHDSNCYLCPGNRRANGERNPDYGGVHVFPNDFSALLATSEPPVAGSMFTATPARGETRVICFSPDHGATLADLDRPALEAVVNAWVAQAEELGRRFVSVQLFENKGAAMGCSNPHPHGQVWATDFVPDELAIEDAHQRAWADTHGAPLLAEVAAREADGGRLVEQTGDWLAIVPFWASWPFELLLLPRFPVQRLPALTPPQRADLALILGRIARRYDALFRVSFPYSMGWHGAPFDGGDAAHWQLHAHFYPPLLRSATVRKFMVGFEMLAEAQRDLTPEQAAQRLREAM